jgi:hypothetical protein
MMTTTEEKIDWAAVYAEDAKLAANFVKTFAFSRKFGVMDGIDRHHCIAFANVGYGVSSINMLAEVVRRLDGAVKGYGWSTDREYGPDSWKQGPYSFAVVVRLDCLSVDQVERVLDDCWEAEFMRRRAENERPLLKLADVAKIGGAN